MWPFKKVKKENKPGWYRTGDEWLHYFANPENETTACDKFFIPIHFLAPNFDVSNPEVKACCDRCKKETKHSYRMD